MIAFIWGMIFAMLWFFIHHDWPCNTRHLISMMECHFRCRKLKISHISQRNERETVTRSSAWTTIVWIIILLSFLVGFQVQDQHYERQCSLSSALWSHMSLTRDLQLTLSWALFSSWWHVLFTILMSASNFLLNAFFSFLLFFLTWRFQVGDWLLVKLNGFCIVSPVHIQNPFLVYFLIGSWFFDYHSR